MVSRGAVRIDKRDLSVIIPAFREENRITKCIEESLFFFRHNKNIGRFELIFVADKSGDRTISIIKDYEKRNPEVRLAVNRVRQEKGGSIKIGVSKARYRTILFYDADLSTPLFEVNKFLKLIGKHDMLIASRGLKESKVEKQWLKIFMSRGFSLLKRLVLNIKFSDTQCGFKMFTSRCRVLFRKQTVKSSTFDVEILFIAKLYGFRIKEVPVTWIDSDMSNFSTVRNVYNVLRDLVRIRYNYFKGRYDRS